MAIVSSLFAALLAPGLVTPVLAADFGLLLVVVYIVKELVIPAILLNRRGLQVDALAGTSPKHWLYGHMLECPNNERGLLNAARRTSSFPTMFNQWLALSLSILGLHHSDTAAILLLSGAPKDNLGYRFVRPWIGDGLLTTRGEKWHRNRHLLTPAFHFSILKGYTHIFNECAEVMLDKWEKAVGKATEVAEDIGLMTLDAMLKCAMSSVTDCQKTSGRHPYIKAVQDMSELIMTRVEKPYLLLDFIFWRSKYGRRFKEAADIVHNHAEKVIAERKLQMQSMKNLNSEPEPEDDAGGFVYGGKQRLDFLDILLQTRDEHGNGFSDKEIRDEVDTFLFEGHDTVASGLSWCMYNLAKYPEFQEKCRDEVEAVLGERDYVEWGDYPRFPYLSMFMKESMRLYPPVTSVSRQLEQPLTLRSSLNKPEECTIPSKTIVSLFIFGLHRNPHLWENPEVFDPERFTKENISKRPAHAFLPFSAGPRNCIGQNFAMNEMKTVLARTLKRYRFFLDSDTPKPEMQPSVVLRSANGIFVKIERLDKSGE